MSTDKRQLHARFIIFGVLLVLVGLFLPRDWYDALPTNPDMPAPAIKGVTLLQWITVLEGFVLILLGWKRWVYVYLEPGQRLPVAKYADPGTLLSARSAMALLGITTLVALVLRCIELGSDFWIDEVIAIRDVAEMPVLAVIGSYIRSNVHLLNTLLMKLSTGAFGEAEWSARLPVVLFGTATIPAIYAATRYVASRHVSIGAALLLAVSYHHIFFSQNARGYVPYVFFSLLSTIMLIQALRDDRPRSWVLYALTTVLNFASLLISGFVFAAHIIIGGVALIVLRLNGQSPIPLFWRLLLVFGVTTIFGFQLYSLQIPQILAYIGTSYSAVESGFWLLSPEFWIEVARGLGAGFSPGLALLALPVLLLGAIGFIDFARRHWVLAASLVLPLVLTALLLLIFGLTASPRFFLLGLAVAIITAVVTLDLCVRFVAGKLDWSPGIQHITVIAVVLLLSVASLSTLGRYYDTPKQPYRASLEYAAAERRRDEIVVAIHAAALGAEYYAAHSGLNSGEDFFVVNSIDEFEALLSTRGSGGTVLLTSMHRALGIVHPDLKERIARDWTPASTFPATIGDGEITVWTEIDRRTQYSGRRQ